jgi:hypothetical protein
MRATKLQLPSNSGPLTNQSGLVLVHNVRETSGSASAVYRLWDGTEPGGNLLLTIEVAAGASSLNSFALGNLPFETGLYFELVSGVLEGQVTVTFSRAPDEVVGVAGSKPLLTLADLDEH